MAARTAKNITNIVETVPLPNDTAPIVPNTSTGRNEKRSIISRYNEKLPFQGIGKATYTIPEDFDYDRCFAGAADIGHKLLLMRTNKFLFDYVGGQVDDLKGENVGDFKCHDFLNHPDCLYDMGDCCELDVDEDEGDTCYSCHCYAESKSSGKLLYSN